MKNDGLNGTSYASLNLRQKGKKVLFFVIALIALPIGFILLLLCFKVGYYLLCLLLIAFGVNTSTQVDTTKLDATYFIGEYEANYENETEKLILKDNMFYDYIHIQKKDTIIDMGEWSIYHYSRRVEIMFMNFPNNKRTNNIFLTDGTIHSVGFSVKTYPEKEMGDLMFAIDDDNEYTFVKLDKGKNQYYTHAPVCNRYVTLQK